VLLATDNKDMTPPRGTKILKPKYNAEIMRLGSRNTIKEEINNKVLIAPDKD
jgi:hypothetical protein